MVSSCLSKGCVLANFSLLLVDTGHTYPSGRTVCSYRRQRKSRNGGGGRVKKTGRKLEEERITRYFEPSQPKEERHNRKRLEGAREQWTSHDASKSDRAERSGHKQ